MFDYHVITNCKGNIAKRLLAASQTYHVLSEDDDEGEDLEENGGGDSWQPFILPLLTMSSLKTMMNGKISKRTVEETAGSLSSSLCLPCPP